MARLLPLLSLATVITCQPHGYQYQLPKEYNSYSSQQDGGSFSQLEPFRRFLQKYMSSHQTSQDNHPYQYMSHPMANVPVSNIRSDGVKPNMYHHNNDWSQYMDNQNTDWDQYMVGELFFKDHDHHQQHFRDDDDEDEDQLPYTVVEEFQNYEKRVYPSATYVCNSTKVDTAADPLAGLERMNPYEVMMSKRYQKTPRSQMFMELFRYIQGVNQDQQEIEMTRPVVVFHNVTKETTLGNYEEVVMCFYLPEKYQENHHHENYQHKDHQHEGHHQENHQHEDHQHEDHQHEDHQHENHHQEGDEPSPRHAPLPPPQPMENGRVYLYNRPAMQVFVRTFGGFALTHQTWEDQREILENDILGQAYNPAQYFTATYDNPWKLTNKRNEVWIQSLQPFQTLPADVVGDKARNSFVEKGNLKSKLKSRKAPKTT